MVFPKLLLIPIIAAFITQAIKFLLQVSKGEWNWQMLQEYGGMPSAHTSFVVSLTTVIGLSQGWTSAPFAISFVFAIITIRDAIGLRQAISLHGKTLNMLIKELPDQEEKKFPHKLAERLGHTPLQALVGGSIGLVLALILYAFLPS